MRKSVTTLNTARRTCFCVTIIGCHPAPNHKFRFDIDNQADLKEIKESDSPEKSLPALFKDEDDDLDFVKGLFRKTIINNDEYQNTIIKQAKNWEEDRIAMMDFLLMKMAICELEEFPTVPIKVTLNEYIELSKNYSTPKSKLFINGILDKLIPQLKAEGKINKSGRGLKE